MPALSVLTVLGGLILTLLAIGSFGRLVSRLIRLEAVGIEGALTRFYLGAAALSTTVFALTASGLTGVRVLTIVTVLVLAIAPPRLAWQWLLAWRRLEAAHSRTAAIAVLAAIPFAAVYFVNAAAPEVSPDGSTYHLGLVRAYLESSGFTSAAHDMYAALSQGMEMLFLFAFTFGGHASAALVHLAFLFPLAIGVYAIGARAGRPSAGAVAALLVFCSPVVGRTATVAYVDVALSGILVCLFLLTEDWRKSRNQSVLIAAGILAGFAFAVKYTGVVAFAYLTGTVIWSERRSTLRPLLIAGGAAFLVMLPWLAKNLIDVGNPIAPFGNAIFENPYFSEVAEADYASSMRNFNQVSIPEIPMEVTVRGYRLLGLLGPVFLLVPIGLLTLRDPYGRRIVLASLVFLAPYAANIGTRFLLPALPFLALGLALVLDRVRAAGLSVLVVHAVLSWPWTLPLYSAPHAWKIYEFPWRAALRIEPEYEYIRARMGDYELGRTLEGIVPRGEVVFSHMSLQRAYQSSRVVVGYQSSFGRRVRDILWTPAFEHLWPGFRHTFRAAAPVVIHGLRIEQTGTAAHRGEEWSISEIGLSLDGVRVGLPAGSTARASRNRWFTGYAIDGNAVTRWSNGCSMRPGEWIEIDFPEPVEAEEIVVAGTRDQWSARMRVSSVGPGGSEEFRQTGMEAASAPAELRSLAARALRSEGIGWLLIHKDDHGAEEFRNHAEEWGLEPVPMSADVTLYRVERIEDENSTQPSSPNTAVTSREKDSARQWPTPPLKRERKTRSRLR